MSYLVRCRKALATLVGGVLAWVDIAWVPDGTITRPEWYALAVVLATAAGVYAVPNQEPTP